MNVGQNAVVVMGEASESDEEYEDVENGQETNEHFNDDGE